MALIFHLSGGAGNTNPNFSLGGVISTTAIVDAVDKHRKLEKEENVNQNQETLLQAAKILRDDTKLHKKEVQTSSSRGISTEAASKMVPGTFSHFIASLLADRVHFPTNQQESCRVSVDRQKKIS